MTDDEIFKRLAALYEIGRLYDPANVADFENSPLSWVKAGQDWRLSLSDGFTVIVAVQQGGGCRVFLVGGGEPRALSGVLSPLEAQEQAEAFAREHAPASFIERAAPWRSSSASSKQINLLRRLGVTVQGPLSKGRAAELITAGLRIANPAA
jgi:hypothetical protein